jgi:hypothetical protein
MYAIGILAAVEKIVMNHMEKDNNVGEIDV